MAYKSSRDKVKEYFEGKVLPTLKKNYMMDLDFYKTVALASQELNVPRAVIEEYIKTCVDAGILVEFRVLELSTKQKEIIREQQKKDAEEDFKKVGLA